MQDFTLSLFTLSLHEASGWYKVNYTLAEPLFWGRGLGCDFLDTVCINSAGNPVQSYFCSKNGEQGCSADRNFKATCRTSATVAEVPPAMSYFSNQSALDSFSDNCPYYLADEDCRVNVTTSFNIFVDEYRGPGSKCFKGSLMKKQYKKYLDTKATRGNCLSYTCEGGILKVSVGSIVIPCQTAGLFQLDGDLVGTFECPDPAHFCQNLVIPTCPNLCSNNGECDPKTGTCKCANGWVSEDCSVPPCKNSCSGKGKCQANGVCLCDDGWGSADCSAFALHMFCTRCEKTSFDCFGDQCTCNALPQRSCDATKNQITNFFNSSTSEDNRLYLIIGASIGGLLLLMILICICCCCCRSSAKRAPPPPPSAPRV
eukprot:TRINITY_DN8333_c0_g1_i3.p1 TRINITY_DN8333_c0_g1~~TRINITY_DN8333_c0_g1_i3.p1  ORF type:complete len:371 (+),score=55.93 TRINITY_DN8333_c0_g1_i3:620-1732(+)